MSRQAHQATSVGRLLLQRGRLHAWLLAYSLRQPVFRRRAVRFPLATLTTMFATLGARWRSATSGAYGIERLQAVMVINLTSRQDRLASFMAEMRRLKVERVTRFDAIGNPAGKLGCALSHLECARTMVEHSWEAMMICEDDAQFLVGRRELDMLIEAFLDDPRAEVACLAYREEAVEPYNSLFLRASKVTTRACYLVKSTIVRDLIHVCEDGVEGLTAGGDPAVYAGDQIWKRLQGNRVFLIPTRRAAYQAPGYSDIEGRVITRVQRS
jgi:hypothetical protein